jgi:hypothetical protein
MIYIDCILNNLFFGLAQGERKSASGMGATCTRGRPSWSKKYKRKRPSKPVLGDVEHGRQNSRDQTVLHHGLLVHNTISPSLIRQGEVNTYNDRSRRHWENLLEFPQHSGLVCVSGFENLGRHADSTLGQRIKRKARNESGREAVSEVEGGASGEKGKKKSIWARWKF